MSLLHLLELAETRYVEVYGNYPEQLLEVLLIYLCIIESKQIYQIFIFCSVVLVHVQISLYQMIFSFVYEI